MDFFNVKSQKIFFFFFCFKKASFFLFHCSRINPIMSTYENKGTNRKGNTAKKGQAHQNSTSWKANKNSKKSLQIANLPVYGLCKRCTDVILWRKKYKKYKPLTTVKKW